MQTILGSGGAIGLHLARSLKEYTSDIRLVSRKPEKVNPTDQLMSADLLNPADVDRAVEGSSVVYVTIGFPYSLQVWKASWPPFLTSVISACEKHKCKLVFFDNIYLYDNSYLDGMTEETPVNPPSKKGKIRAELVRMILDEVKAGRLTALIARSADFYGPSIRNSSMMTETVIKNLSKGKRAMWMGPVKYRHSFTYTPDAGRATAILGNTPDAYGQVWHLPTEADPPTGKEWIITFARELNVPPKFRAVPKFMVRLLGLFVPIMKEMVEMLYQYDRNYVFDSSKFETRFGMKPTPYLDGIREIVKSDYR